MVAPFSLITYIRLDSIEYKFKQKNIQKKPIENINKL